jgi:hypothetical protein
MDWVTRLQVGRNIRGNHCSGFSADREFQKGRGWLREDPVAGWVSLVSKK